MRRSAGLILLGLFLFGGVFVACGPGSTGPVAGYLPTAAPTTAPTTAPTLAPTAAPTQVPIVVSTFAAVAAPPQPLPTTPPGGSPPAIAFPTPASSGGPLAVGGSIAINATNIPANTQVVLQTLPSSADGTLPGGIPTLESIGRAPRSFAGPTRFPKILLNGAKVKLAYITGLTFSSGGYSIPNPPLTLKIPTPPAGASVGVALWDPSRSPAPNSLGWIAGYATPGPLSTCFGTNPDGSANATVISGCSQVTFTPPTGTLFINANATIYFGVYFYSSSVSQPTAPPSTTPATATPPPGATPIPTAPPAATVTGTITANPAGTGASNNQTVSLAGVSGYSGSLTVLSVNAAGPATLSISGSTGAAGAGLPQTFSLPSGGTQILYYGSFTSTASFTGTGASLVLTTPTATSGTYYLSVIEPSTVSWNGQYSSSSTSGNSVTFATNQSLGVAPGKTYGFVVWR